VTNGKFIGMCQQKSDAQVRLTQSEQNPEVTFTRPIYIAI